MWTDAESTLAKPETHEKSAGVEAYQVSFHVGCGHAAPLQWCHPGIDFRADESNICKFPAAARQY